MGMPIEGFEEDIVRLLKRMKNRVGGRCLEWGALSLKRAVGGVIVFWDNRVLQTMEVGVGNFFVSCCYRNCDYNIS